MVVEVGIIQKIYGIEYIYDYFSFCWHYKQTISVENPTTADVMSRERKLLLPVFKASPSFQLLTATLVKASYRVIITKRKQ